jgi:hypothetical protein
MSLLFQPLITQPGASLLHAPRSLVRERKKACGHVAVTL